MSKARDLLFLPLELPTLEVPYQRLFQAYRENSTPDSYRNCRHIALYTSRGSTQPGLFDKNGLCWTETAKQKFPDIIDYIESTIWPWMQPRGRVAIICTESGAENPPHIDCAKTEFQLPQVKFRHVLHGHVEDLTFIGNGGDLEVPSTKRPFIMSGAWPHKMKNNSPGVKFTLAIGSPWQGQTSPEFDRLLSESAKKYEPIFSSALTLPVDYDKLFYNY